MINVGYTVAMFAILLITAAVIITAANYGIAKDSQIAPLKAENMYAERETGKAQTGLTINNTCLIPDSSYNRYTKAQGTETYSGPYSLYLSVRNNGSTILNPNIATLLYNTSYINFTITDFEEEQHEADEVCGDTSGYFSVWPPLTYVCMKASGIYINTPDKPSPGNALRLLVTAENGVSTIAPTSPTNFTGFRTEVNTTYTFRWNASYDEDGIAYYRLYAINNAGDTGDCPPETYAIEKIPGYTNTLIFDYTSVCAPSCNTDYFYVTAVDSFENEGVQSRTLKCLPVAGKECEY